MLPAMLKPFQYLTVLLLFTISAKSQNCDLTLEGYVIDFHDNSALQKAELRILKTNRFVISNDKGYFSFDGLCPGKYDLEISHLKCETLVKKITLDTSKKINFKLEHHLEELEAVYLKAEQNTITNTAQETVIKAYIIEDYSSGSLGDITETIAGVSTLNTGNNIVKPIIHGLHSSRVITIQNGVRMQDQEWGLEHAPTVDVNALQEVSLIKGASALAYSGDAIGGAIVLKHSRVYRVDSLFGRTIGVYDSNNNGFTLSSSLFKTTDKGWFVGGQGSYRRFGDSQAPDYVLSNTGLDFKAFSMQTGFNSYEQSFRAYYSYVDNEIGILSSAHIGGIEQLIDAINNGVPSTIRDFTYDINDPRQRIRHHLAKAEYTRRFSNLGKLSLQYDYQRNQRQEFDRRRGDFKGVPSIDLLLQTHGLQSKFLFDQMENKTFETGIQFQYLDNFADPATGVRRLIPDYNRVDLGAFVTSEWELENDYTLEGAVRYDYNHIDAKKFYRIIAWEEQGYDEDFSDIIIRQDGAQYLTNPVYDFHNISLALGAKKTLDNHEFAFNYSLSNRAPNMSELFSDGLHQSVARVEVGNLRLDRETANQFSLTYQFNTPKLNLLVEPYLNHIANYIFIAPTEQGITTIGNAGAFLEYEFLTTDALLYGVDLNLNYHINEHFSFQNSTAFLIGEDLDNDEPLIDMPPFNTRNTIQYFNGKWKNLSLGLTWEFFAEQNRFPDYNFVFNVPSTGEDESVDVSTPPDAYNLVHFNGSIQMPIFKESALEIGFNIQNLFNTNYRNYLNRLRFFADEVGRNFQIQLKINY